MGVMRKESEGGSKEEVVSLMNASTSIWLVWDYEISIMNLRSSKSSSL